MNNPFHNKNDAQEHPLRRTNIYLHPRQLLWLDTYAGQQGVSRAEIVRRAIEHFQKVSESERDPDASETSNLVNQISIRVAANLIDRFEEVLGQKLTSTRGASVEATRRKSFVDSQAVEDAEPADDESVDDEDAEAVWQQCLEIIRDNISRQSFKTWFEPLKALGLEQDGDLFKLTVQLPSRFYYEWFEEHYFALLRKTITKILGPQGRLFYNIVIEKKNESSSDVGGVSMLLPARQPVDEPPPLPYTPTEGQNSTPLQLPSATPLVIPGIPKTQIDSQLNTSYTFERFVEGDCNRLARSASLAIAQQPGSTAFNPLLIYGGVGLGKTHLIQAIGNYVKETHKTQSVLYVSSERFTNEFVQAIQHNRASQFSLFYRQIDLLIIDDVQFFGGKEKTQEEFFHIFNALHQSGKQIVLSADRSPREIQGIEERLLSRFQWGLTADLQVPELETRTAILYRKAEDDGIDFPHDVIEFIAHNIKSNIRELEGALIRLQAHRTLHKREVDLVLAKEVLRDMIKDTRVNLTIEEIQRIVCEYFDMPEDLVRAKTRKREVVQVRQVAMYFTKQLTDHSLKTIGLHFGGRDHTTVIYAVQCVEDQIETNPKFREMIEEIKHKIDLRSR